MSLCGAYDMSLFGAYMSACRNPSQAHIQHGCTHACVRAQVLDGMVQLDEHKVIHRDLALRNVLAFAFDPSDSSAVSVKLTDYGLATSGSSLICSSLPGCLCSHLSPARGSMTAAWRRACS